MALRLLTVESAGEGAFEALIRHTGYKVAVGGQMVGKQVREQDCRRNVRRDMLQRGDERLQFLLHPHVDVDRCIFLDLTDFEKAAGVLLFVLLASLPSFCGLYSGRVLRRGRFEVFDFEAGSAGRSLFLLVGHNNLF